MSPATRLAPTRTLFAISNIFVCLFSFTPPPCAKHFRWSHFALQAQKSLRGVPGLRSLGPLGAPEHESTADSPGLGCLCATFFFGKFDRTLVVVTKRSRGSMLHGSVDDDVRGQSKYLSGNIQIYFGDEVPRDRSKLAVFVPCTPQDSLVSSS
jgi:hypothetical protein